MIPPEVHHLLSELDRQEFFDIERQGFDAHTPVVNGISDAESIEGYTLKITELHEAFNRGLDQCDIAELRQVKRLLSTSILKLRKNFGRIEEFKGRIEEIKQVKFDHANRKSVRDRARLPIFKLFVSVYNEQYRVLNVVIESVQDLIDSIKPDTTNTVDPELLFDLDAGIKDKRIIQRIANTLRSEKYISSDHGGNANNFKLLFRQFNTNLTVPDKIKWLKDYQSLSFVLKTLTDLKMIKVPRNSKTNQYAIGCHWFVDEHGNSFAECSDDKKRRFRGRVTPYKQLVAKLNGDIAASM